ncbi:MAG: MBL fold metallo-hydrolase [Aquabacterium sp.]|jgi:glyoxylase-like metal-dependent hydrolase (beta-lactamase superfamily II)|uniref:MBL fold metallo-hydrolase n=1 Tax=Aquabacterium sp. TaxID=1872578 RepID=UPI001B57CC68|nr:MBL fold metallo-hydrolase [Aquabacterium sp.]MBP7133161.1 MBL fold metallo-hydrolase [Aquabacterium sp.]MBP9063902.1 MBL fold metallo-hydrolase [Aquabacterium sp.]MDQ5927543.1 fold metallo-hydrolase [Pseudomonadota bacterium]
MKLLKRMGLSLAVVGLLLAASAALISAQDPRLPVPETPPDLGQNLPSVQPPQGLAFSILPTAASNGAAEALVVGGGSWFSYRRPVQAAVLVRHPKATFLFDTGLGREHAAQFAVNTLPNRMLLGYGEVRPVIDQLTAAGWSPERIRMIVPSHMHWDHISGLVDFPNAEVWVQPQEQAQAEHGAPPAFLRSQFETVRRWRALQFTDGPYIGFERSLDLFDDGAVVLVPLAGHTAGHIGMFVNLPSGKRYFFTGDVTWTLEGIAWPADRAKVLRRLIHLDHDEPLNQAAIVRLHQIHRRFPQLVMVPAHDEHVMATLPHFPAFQD